MNLVKFSIENLKVVLRLKADLGIPFTTLEQATMKFYDSRFKNQEQTLNIDEQPISMNVILNDMENHILVTLQGI